MGAEMKPGREVVVDCEACGEIFIHTLNADDTTILKGIFGHEIECPFCEAWCPFEIDDDDDVSPED